MFDKILIANRGEIARRIIRTCKGMTIRTVAVFSDADVRAPYVGDADESEPIGPAPARESYLDWGRIIGTALKHGCHAIHPGYGFLSENAEFAKRVADEGIVFIGPPPEAIATLGDKMASKALAIRAGVPVVPGYDEPLLDGEEAEAIAERVGFPLLLKPAAGGGGRGMRIVNRKDELAAALATCREETRKAFGDDRIFMERYITRPRHIEVQVMADHHGNVIHLGERECSIQRRYQKIIEETPSFAVTEELRERMGSVACALAREARYASAGTVEFILDQKGNFYFLEMNTRLQVEHPVTEMVTGLDLVELQIRVAAGEPLPVRQEDVTMKGWAIEARICAEDPSRDFFPTTGIVTRYAVPKSRNIRVDGGIEAGSVITAHYDSLLAKVAACGESRGEARRTLIRGLNGYHIEGLVTNVDFANAVVNHPAFIAGDLNTDFIEDHFEGGQSKTPPPLENIHRMIMAVVLIYHTRRSIVRESLKPMAAVVGGEPTARTEHKYIVRTGDDVFEVVMHGDPGPRGGRCQVTVDGTGYDVKTPEFEYYRRRLKLTINGTPHRFRLRYSENHIWACFCGIAREFEVYSPLEWKLNAHVPRVKKKVEENVLRCPMPGMVVAVSVDEGAFVRRGQELVRMESMKMETGIASPCDGLVEEVHVRQGNAVETDDILMTFKLLPKDGGQDPWETNRI